MPYKPTRPAKIRHVLAFRGDERLYRDESGAQLPIPKPVKLLEGLAGQEWDRVAPKLHALGLLTGLDVIALEMYCLTFATYARVRTEVAAAKRSGVRIDPNVLKIPAEAKDDLRRTAAKFGMTIGRDGRMIVPE